MSNTSSTQPQRILNKVSEYVLCDIYNALLNSRRCRERGDFTDFKIVCDGVDLDVHKVIICSQSPVFQAACTGNFKEAADSTYQMTDESIPVVRKMLDYLYTGDYSELIDDSPTDVPPKVPLLSISTLRLHAQLFALGDKYCIQELCDAAARKYSNRVIGHFDPFEYLDSIPDVFFSPLIHDARLKKLAARLSRDNLRFHLRDTSVREKYDSIAAQVPDFVKDVLDTYFDTPLLGDCANCGRGRPMSALQVRCQKCGRGNDLSRRSWGFGD